MAKPKKIGRPSDYSQELAEHICEQLAEGKSLRAICTPEDMPHRATVFRWLAKDKLFSDQYARAREEQAESLADDMLAIADQYDSAEDKANTDHINRARLRIDTRKWIASKLKPKKYGDKIAVGGDKDMDPIEVKDVSIEDMARRAAFALAKAGQEPEE